MKRVLAPALGCLLLIACDGAPASSSRPDAAPTLEGGVAGMDASSAGHGGRQDGGTHSTAMDADTPMSDAGHARDAGRARDAGHAPDSGHTHDAGDSEDSGVAGPDDDAGAAAGPDCVYYRAHAAGSSGSYSVLPGERYVLFSFASPWPGTAHVVSYRALLDNAAVTAEMRLRATPGVVSVGAVVTPPAANAHEDTSLLGLWAPGAPDVSLPDGWGIALGAGITLEIHYANTLGSAAPDASGFALCALDAPQTQELAWHVLGTTSISGVSASGTCDPSSSDPITISKTWPTMRAHGVNMKITIHRVAGATELMLDRPFDANFQLLYDTPSVVQPGDTLVTECAYNAPVAFGSTLADESCFAFVLASPPGALSSANSALNPTYGRELCLP